MIDGMVSRCHRDLIKAVEEDRFKVETPTSSVGETVLDDVSIGKEREVHRYVMTDDYIGPWRLQLGFIIPMDNPVAQDLNSFEEPVVVYGNQHVWWLGQPDMSEVTLEGHPEDEELLYQHERGWCDVEHIGWRY